tara:strand:- start:735 stop:929 length:195 start_codon:yes stop_codon:yes gene_type:complete
MLVDNGDHDPKEMAKSLRRLPSQPRPSENLPTGILGGLPQVNRLAKRWLKKSRDLGNIPMRQRA